METAYYNNYFPTDGSAGYKTTDKWGASETGQNAYLKDLCEELKKPVVQLAVQDVSKPIGVAAYKTIRTIPEPYKTLAPVMDGVQKILAQSRENIHSPDKGTE